MSIFSLDMKCYKQQLQTKLEKKQMYGEIFTPFHLIDDMLDMYDEKVFSNLETTWLDAGAGTGFFSMCLYWRLMKHLKKHISDKKKRHNHIIENMIYMAEIQDSNIDILKNMFGNKANIIHGDFLCHKEKYDNIIGNPPYNSNGLKKVPTNNTRKKKDDGKTIWISFVRHSLDILKKDGHLLLVIPSLWMRPDKAKTYNLITSYKLNKIKCLTNTQTNQVFLGEAQTPTSCFLLSKKENDNIVELYDSCLKKYITYNYSVGDAIPVFGASVVSKVKLIDSHYLVADKTNLPPKNVSISSIKNDKHKYPNIRTALLEKLDVKLVIEYSDKPLVFSGKRKIVLGHKMYGFPFIDRDGVYGISNRDNYVICNDDINVLERIRDFLSTKFALYMFESTRYRMRFLEKEAFWFLPGQEVITNIGVKINDEVIASYVGLNEFDRESIKKLHSKNYSFKYIF